MKAVETAANVPIGMERPGSRKSPLRLAPSIMPTTAGKTMPKTSPKEHSPPHCSLSTVAGSSTSRRPYLPDALPEVAQLTLPTASGCHGDEAHSALHAKGRKTPLVCGACALRRERSAVSSLAWRLNQSVPMAAQSERARQTKMNKLTRANAAAPLSATKKSTKSVPDEMAMRLADVSCSLSKKVEVIVCVKATVLNVTFTQ
mmetsp:Transcript_29527/g.62093  ORF Transcript_29527/g.62093 Transcript_29527/m.62093 type:complete len:202 (-) Transcript_29527:519-1124(-)